VAKTKTKPKKKGGGLGSKLNSQVKAETSLKYDPQSAELGRQLTICAAS
jgi:hypothetical protein